MRISFGEATPTQTWPSSAVPTLVGFGELSGWARMLAVCLMLKLLSWSAPALALPCLNSSMDCLEILTQQAIAQSSEIEAINQQLELTAERQEYAEARQWTNYLTMDPVRLVQNVLGGGDVQRDRIEIATLELEAANLIRRREEVAEGIAREIIDLVLNYEHLDRQAVLVVWQLAYTDIPSLVSQLSEYLNS